MKISAKDIKRRIYNLNESYSSNKVNYNEYIHEEALRCENTAAITESMKLLRNIALSDTKNEIKTVEKMLDIFETVYEKCGSSRETDVAKHYLTEVTDRVRNPKQMATLLKRRISLGTRGKGVTKFSNKVNDSNTLNSRSSQVSKNIQNSMQSLSPKLQVQKLSPPTINTGARSSSSISTTDDNNVTECFYNELINRCNVNAEADRVLTNYDRLSKRFNIDRVLDLIGLNIPDDIDLFCDLFNTWSDEEMSKKSKFNIAIETALYINEKHNNRVDRQSLIESIVDYHLFNNESFNDVYSYLESNSMITESDLSYYNKDYDNRFNTRNHIRYLIEEESDNADKNLSSNIKNYKKSDNKNPDNFKKVLSNAYTKTPDQVINNSPKIFDIFRFFVIMGTIAINPILRLITFFTDQFLKREYSREETNKMIMKYEKEIDKVSKKISKCEDGEKKNRLKQYKSSMENNLYKLQDYEKELYTDEEQEKKEEERDAKRDHSGDDFDFDFNFDEATKIISLAEYVMNIDTSRLENCIENNIEKFVKTNTIDSVTEFAVNSDGFISIDRLKRIYENYYESLRRSNKKDYISMDVVKSNINKLYKGYRETNDDDNNSLRLIESYYLFNEAISMITNESPYFLEVSFQNTFNVVKTKIQNAVATMSDKEKSFSSKLDTDLAGFQKDVNSFFTSNEREKILSGKIIPKASTMLKGALAFGLVSWIVDPLLAIIGVLGYIGVSKHCNDKERRAILDEIDVELEMVEKYIQIADQKEDMKAMKNLLKTKKRLQKERLRIKYKMKVNGEKIAPEDLK